jgi:hypothetical protein
VDDDAVPETVGGGVDDDVSELALLAELVKLA